MKTEQDYQRVYAGINLDAVMHNLEKMHTLIKDDTKIIAVIKQTDMVTVPFRLRKKSKVSHIFGDLQWQHSRRERF